MRTARARCRCVRCAAHGAFLGAQIPLSGANSIVGRAVVVHELQDDMGKGDHSQPGTQGKTSKTTGNAGASRGAVQLLLRR